MVDNGYWDPAIVRFFVEEEGLPVPPWQFKLSFSNCTVRVPQILYFENTQRLGIVIDTKFKLWNKELVTVLRREKKKSNAAKKYDLLAMFIVIFLPTYSSRTVQREV